MKRASQEFDLMGRSKIFNQASYIGVALMMAFAALAAWRWSTTGLIFFLLLVVRDLAAAYFLLVRRANDAGSAGGIQNWIAYSSAALPLAYLPISFHQGWVVQASVDVFVIFGYTLSTIALLELGKSFGVSPANRGAVRSGIYRWVRHPMYVGYGIAEFGLVMANPANGFIFILSALLYSLRAYWENQRLEPFILDKQRIKL